MIFEGRVWKFGDNINTDMIMPVMAGKQMYSSQDSPDRDKKIALQFCMSANRPSWAQQVQEGDIIIAGNNWGCGSSRPAPRLIKSLGISVIVAESIARLYFRNSVNIGLPAITCVGIFAAFNEGERARVNIETGEVNNLSTGITIKGEAIPADSPPMQILKAGGLSHFKPVT